MRPATRRVTRCAALIAAAVLLGGCQLPTLPSIKPAGGKLQFTSQFDDTITRPIKFDGGIYNADGDQNATAVFWSGPQDDPDQVLTLRVFVHPKAGQTPIDKTATNATMHLIVFGPSDQTPTFAGRSRNVGVYSGSGFVFVRQDIGSNRLDLSLWEATLRLTDRSEDFVDRAIGVEVAGELTVRREDERVADALHRVQIMLRDRLGFPRFVSHPSDDQPQTDG